MPSVTCCSPTQRVGICRGNGGWESPRSPKFVTLPVHFIPINHLRWPLIRFQIDPEGGDTESPSANGTNVFPSCLGYHAIQLCLRHKQLLQRMKEKTPPRSGAARGITTPTWGITTRNSAGLGKPVGFKPLSFSVKRCTSICKWA